MNLISNMTGFSKQFFQRRPPVTAPSLLFDYDTYIPVDLVGTMATF